MTFADVCQNPPRCILERLFHDQKDAGFCCFFKVTSRQSHVYTADFKGLARTRRHINLTVQMGHPSLPLEWHIIYSLIKGTSEERDAAEAEAAENNEN